MQSIVLPAKHGKKPELREVSNDLFQRARDEFAPGTVLEIGFGGGFFTQFFPNAITSDVAKTPWIDVAADAQLLPFGNACFDNLFLFDVCITSRSRSCFFTRSKGYSSPAGNLL